MPKCNMILAGYLVAVLCTFCWQLPVTTSASFAESEQQQQQQGHGQGQEHENVDVSVDFEVFGKVQGVGFGRSTKDTARKIGLVGWVQSTNAGTLVGVVQGPQDKVARMKIWLETVGSPKSKIERTEFKNERTIDEFEYDEFTIVGRDGVPLTRRGRQEL